MASGRTFLRSTISLLVHVYLCLYKVSFTSYSQLSADLDCRITFHGYLQSPKGNISFSTWTFQPRGRRYLSARISLYPNHEASFTLTRISNSGDVESNPGPAINSKIITLCSVCQKNVRSYNRAIECDVCKHWCHIKCGEISLREYRRLQNKQNFDWTCPSCISTLRTLPFADISNLDSSDGSFTSHGDDSCTEPASQQTLASDSCTEPASQQTLASEDYLENLSSILNYSSKDLRVAHLNICSLRYKIDELRLLQRICGFDILGISETHLDSSVPDNFLQIDGLQLIRRDITKCKGGGVALYYAEHLTAVHRKDLLVRDIKK